MTASPSEFPRIASLRQTTILAAVFLVLAIGGALSSDGRYGRGQSSRSADGMIDVLLAVGLWPGWAALNGAWQQVVASASGSPVQSMLPVTRPEMLAWIVLALSAGISEELVFRGYFQRQIRAMIGSVAAALGLQAVLFRVSHGYQGFGPCLGITAYGLLFGLLVDACVRR